LLAAVIEVKRARWLEKVERDLRARCSMAKRE
jgi:hypothetical protein